MVSSGKSRLSKWEPDDLFALPAQAIDFGRVRAFVLRAETIDALTESTVLELKRSREGTNIVDAVAGLANTDGGLVLVGVADDETGDDRFGGVEVDEVDKLRSQLRHMLAPDVEPETIPVVTPTGRMLLVIRVDAGAARHPVVVRGRVMVRAPGETIRASREQIIALVERGQRAMAVPATFEAGYSAIPFSPETARLWQDSTIPVLELRMSGGMSLPHRASATPWLRTPAKEALVAALSDGPVPRLLHTDRVRDFEMTQWAWRIRESRSSWAWLQAEAGRRFDHRFLPRIQSAAHIQLSPRAIQFVIGVGLESAEQESNEKKLAIEELMEWLIGGGISVDAVCGAVAEALDFAEPVTRHHLQGWLQCSTGRATEFLYPPRSTIVLPNDVSGFWFRHARPPAGDIDALGALAREWLTVMLLDAGASHFEHDLEQMSVPKWTRAFDLFSDSA